MFVSHPRSDIAMTLSQRKAPVIPIRKCDDRRSEVRDLLQQSRVERLRVAIAEGSFTIDLERIADGVIDDIIDKGK
jgi:anti-sigma28 factor (negative regulator of flagellin synthesis)